MWAIRKSSTLMCGDELQYGNFYKDALRKNVFAGDAPLGRFGAFDAYTSTTEPRMRARVRLHARLDFILTEKRLFKRFEMLVITRFDFHRRVAARIPSSQRDDGVPKAPAFAIHQVRHRHRRRARMTRHAIHEHARRKRIVCAFRFDM